MCRIRNIKISIKVANSNYYSIIHSLKHLSIYNNFVVLKRKHTFILFKPKFGATISHLNITKIKNFSQIKKAIKEANKLLLGQLILSTLTIDNITATHYLHKPVDLSQFYEVYSYTNLITFANDIFPGLHFKTPIGTAIIFHTGKIIIVGCKSVKQIKKIIKIVKKWIVNMN